MDKIDLVFKLMNNWRHLPSYQLERRVDIFFALYIPQALEEKFGFSIRQPLIPEFPVRKGTINPAIANREKNHSHKIDYLGLSMDGRKVVFVELKTDNSSRRTKQDDYLKAAKIAGLQSLLEGVVEIFCVTSAKRKYFYLIDQLASIGLYHLPDSMREMMEGKNLRGVTNALNEIAITSAVSECYIVYIQPRGSGPDVISFDEFSKTVQKHDDEISSRFASSLLEWVRVKA